MSIWPNISLKTDIFLLILCLNDLCIAINRVFRSPTIIVFLSVFSYSSVSWCLIYLDASRLGAHILMCYVFLMYNLIYHYKISIFFSLPFLFCICPIWYKYGYNYFSLDDILLVYDFLPLQFEFVFEDEMCLLKTAYRRVFCYCDF